MTSPRPDERVEYDGDVLSPLPGLLNTVEGWRAVERWFAREREAEFERGEAEYHDLPLHREGLL